jgi:hypothetical protein
MRQVSVNQQLVFGNDLPFVLIGGMNVIEAEDIVIEVALAFAQQGFARRCAAMDRDITDLEICIAVGNGIRDAGTVMRDLDT